jgi:hypothetical protein
LAVHKIFFNSPLTLHIGSFYSGAKW